ncbi:MAG: phenylacetate--CoA ligase family protein [Veillonellaceae bacterium]|nr:phenylacetate--CoA ligase family protein [Veillonellaceae bacterium]
MTAIDKARAASPLILKKAYRRVVSVIAPFERRIDHGVYRDTRRLLEQTRYWSADRLHDYQEKELDRLLAHCCKQIPYYRKLFGDLEIGSFHSDPFMALSKLPLMDKVTVRQHFDELVARNIPARLRHYETTGGTTDKPLAFFSEKGFSGPRELAFWHDSICRTGYRVGETVAVLRNNTLPAGMISLYNPMRCQLILDPFKLRPDNVHLYIEALVKHGIRYLHAYPSCVSTLIRFCAQRGLEICSTLTAIFAGSENVYPGQREEAEKRFGGRYFSWYGHSEKLIHASECEYSTSYHAFPEYGIVELIDSDGRSISEPGRRGEIVGTGFNNRVMPLLRYRTGDYAEWAPSSACACGRNHPMLVNVHGRWLQELVYGRSGSRISITSINTHSGLFDRVRNMQFVQHEKGKLTLNLIRGEGFSDQDGVMIRSELNRILQDEMEIELDYVDSIETTLRGKHRFLIQNCTDDEPV